tara:strand:+ start:1563 stop:2183 length:621 start_codon:yes stop_codon:yes gene_type:complete
MAAGYKHFTTGSILTAADLEDYNQNQSVMRFASVAARNSALTSVVTDGMLAYNIDLKQTQIYDGTDWTILTEPAQSWTPTITGITTTTGTWVAYYHRSDGWCDYQAELTFGASTAITADVLLTLPKAAFATGIGLHNGSFYDSSVGSTYPLAPAFTASAASIWCRVMNAAGTYGVLSAMSATIPVAYGTGDKFTMRGRYRMTTRYS